ncbi:MAG: hypothetical protein ACRDZR_14820, partial [Acidimicrobiales bacterium]
PGTAAAPGTQVPAGTRVPVALPLAVDRSGLAGLAASVSDSRSPSYHRFASMATVATTYGAGAAAVAADRRVLHADGLPLRLDPTRGALWGVVTAGQVERYFGTTLVASGGVVRPSGTPHPPPGLEGVTGVVGLDASGAPSAPAAATDRGSGGSGSGAQGGSTPPCPATVPTRTSLAQRFGFTRTLAAGADGAGTTVDILSVHRFEPAVFDAYDRCTGASLAAGSIAERVVPATPPSAGGPEIALDSLILTLLAPAARLGVVRFDPSTSIAFPLLELLAGGSVPDVLDVTVTSCEPSLPPADLALSEWLLSALAATGTSTVAAAGDTGSSGCHPASDAPAVTYPASSAFVTAIGGASYGGGPGSPAALSAWDEPGVAGGGGGTSGAVHAPPWQGGTWRRVPDVVAYSVPGGVGSIPVCTIATSCRWRAVGGTSLAATVLGAAAVLLAQEDGTSGAAARWGNLAGAVWRAGAADPGVADVTAGANTTFTAACCRAAPGYDTATGWGLLDPDALGPVLRPLGG